MNNKIIIFCTIKEKKYSYSQLNIWKFQCYSYFSKSTFIFENIPRLCQFDASLLLRQNDQAKKCKKRVLKNRILYFKSFQECSAPNQHSVVVPPDLVVSATTHRLQHSVPPAPPTLSGQELQPLGSPQHPREVFLEPRTPKHQRVRKWEKSVFEIREMTMVIEISRFFLSNPKFASNLEML